VARYIGRHGTKRVAKAVLISAVPPLMLKTAANPVGLPMEVLDGLRASVQADRSQFFKDLSAPFYGANRPGAKVSQGLRDSFWLQGMIAGFPAAHDCIADGTDRRGGYAVLQDRQGSYTESHPWRSARAVLDTQRSGER
jgi:non-heme chloroperoxidase